MEKIGIIGSGTWGTAIAVLLVNNGHEVTLWSAIPAEIEEMAKTRTHRNLPGVTLLRILKRRWRIKIFL